MSSTISNNMNFEMFYEFFYKLEDINNFLIMIFISCVLVYILVILYNYIKNKLNNLSNIFRISINTIINIFKFEKKSIPKIENKDNRDNNINRIEEYKRNNKIKKIKDYKYKLHLLLKNINRTIYKYKVSKQENYNDRYNILKNLKDFRNTIKKMYNNKFGDKILIQRANVLINNINGI